MPNKNGGLENSLSTKVRFRLQDGREVVGQGPGQLDKGFQKNGLTLRERISMLLSS